ncbi:hypothetical protein BX600DRAFT_503742 [Xylariales sp. PMI_506]|nr:hypothetical protein BX600DRAFT_503742 [Xylariales sp. PMI_506]
MGGSESSSVGLRKRVLRGRPRCGACDTCRLKKVKCDEAYPSCKRCQRLGFTCVWPAPDHHLQQSKNDAKRITTIRSAPPLPRLSESNPQITALHSSISDTDTAPRLPQINITDQDWDNNGGPISQDLSSCANSDLDVSTRANNGDMTLTQWILPDAFLSDCIFANEEQFSFVFNTTEASAAALFDGFTTPNSTIDTPSDLAGRSPDDGSLPVGDSSQYFGIDNKIISNSLNIFPQALLAGAREYQALHHFQTIYTCSRVTKDPKWSTYSCILDAAAQKPMVLHFLVAVSSLDQHLLSWNSSEDMVQMSKHHFRLGSDMLSSKVTVQSSDSRSHIDVLISLFLAYCYVTSREILDPEVIDHLSSSAIQYILDYILSTQDAVLSRKSSDDTNQDQNDAITTPTTSDYHCGVRTMASQAQVLSSLYSDKDENLINRVLVLLCWLDILACFQGMGGFIARTLCTRTERLRQIYALQVDALSSYWGSAYPAQELSRDIEHMSIMEFANETMCLFQEVNSLNNEHLKNEGILQVKIRVLQKKYNSIIKFDRENRLMKHIAPTADLVTAMFFFVQIYLFRTTLTKLEQPTPSHIVMLLYEIMQCAHRICSSELPNAQNLLSFPLFIVAIETQDRIHVEWILNKLPSRSSLRSVLLEVRRRQQDKGERLPISCIQDLFRKTA